MDFLDPKKQFRQKVLLLSGYLLIAVAIVIGTIILLYQAYGFGVGKNGTIIQNGLLFLSSQPHPATITLSNDKKATYKTNTRIILPAGLYHVTLSRSGYRSWHRLIQVDGGSVEHFDYPLLFPTKLITKKLPSASYTTAPGVVSQSPDQHWLLVEQSATSPTFDLYDLTNPTKAPTELTLPASIVSKATTSETWQVVQWADDNQHVLLSHTYDGKTEYVLLDRTDASQSVNLSQTLASATFTSLSLFNDKYNQYYLYDQPTSTLSTASLSAPTPTTLLTHVEDFMGYGNNIVLYIDDSSSGPDVSVKEMVGTQSYTIRSLPANTTYLLDTAQYNGSPYVAVGAASDNKIYIYDNPVSQLNADPSHVAVPIQTLLITAPNYLSFSQNSQFIMAEDGQQFAVYDIENQHGYNYQTTQPLDAPQQHAVWMDGDRLLYISHSKLIVFDYDDNNLQTLMPADAAYPVAFDPTYSYMYALAVTAPAAATTPATLNLTQTSLYTPADQP